MKRLHIAIITLLVCISNPTSKAAIIVDDFSNTSLLWPRSADFNDPWTFPTSDLASGTLFGERRVSVAIFNDPVGTSSIEFGIKSGFLSITAAPESNGRLFVYHDSSFAGPFFNLEPALSADGGIRVTFALPLSQNVEALFVLQSTSGRMTLNPLFQAGSSQYFFGFDDFNYGAVDTFTEVYETRWFFDIPTGGGFQLSEIAIIPEPSQAILLMLGSLAIFLMLTRRAMTTPTSRPVSMVFRNPNLTP
jgi:hypothetical protein